MLLRLRTFLTLSALALLSCSCASPTFSDGVQRMIDTSQKREGYTLYSYTLPVFDVQSRQTLCAAYLLDGRSDVQRMFYASVDFNQPEQTLSPIALDDKAADVRQAALCAAQIEPKSAATPTHRMIIVQQQQPHALTNAEAIGLLGAQGGKAYLFVTAASEQPGVIRHATTLYRVDENGISGVTHLNVPGRMVLVQTDSVRKYGAYALYPLAITGDFVVGAVQLVVYIGMARVWPHPVIHR